MEVQQGRLHARGPAADVEIKGSFKVSFLSFSGAARTIDSPSPGAAATAGNENCLRDLQVDGTTAAGRCGEV
ncbi:unnamed protein product [Pleuronectes platessa]|uniref:Uncharacterized protein n=1 Tax=Pleuronectes platessa TaxID=8262 RepID=A0A9N7ZD51_PLEPL|nr:unnamed protein product [Pleuronectes platessa]